MSAIFRVSSDDRFREAFDGRVAYIWLVPCGHDSAIATVKHGVLVRDSVLLTRLREELLLGRAPGVGSNVRRCAAISRAKR